MKGRKTQGEQSRNLAYDPVSVSAFGEARALFPCRDTSGKSESGHPALWPGV